MGQFHYIARVIIREGNQILLVRAIGADNTFLPGGHVEFGETAVHALQREASEEIGYVLEVSEFLGAVEHVWPADTLSNHEINLVFSGKLPALDPGACPISKEPHLELFWAPVNLIDEYNLQPTPLVNLIKQENPLRTFWGSTMEPARK